MKRIIIAVDGHSSCGKSTMAKALAKKTGYTYIDTGAMYRAVTLYALENGLLEDGHINAAALEKEVPGIGISFQYDSDGVQHTMLDGRDVEREIRGMEVSQNVSPVSALPFVREAMVARQREMGKAGAVIMDGRDIGTTVFPNAQLKIFVTADAQVRAKRRFDEMTAKGESPVFDEVLENVRQRDYIDSHREVSPLRQAPDAIVLDNSNMTIEEQDRWLMDHFTEATKD